jgi:hypothetical protein
MKRLLIVSVLGLYVVSPALLGLYLVAHGVGGVAPPSAMAAVAEEGPRTKLR